MPNLLDARLRHAILFLQQMDAAKDRYLAGDSEAAVALLDFDHNQANIIAAQKWLAEYVPEITDEEIQSDELARAIVDLCNTYPDAGAYLVSLRLGPNERIQWLQAALNASQRLGNAITTQAHLGNLGLAHDELGDFSTSIECLEQALKLAEQIGDRPAAAIAAFNLGHAYMDIPAIRAASLKVVADSMNGVCGPISRTSSGARTTRGDAKGSSRWRPSGMILRPTATTARRGRHSNLDGVTRSGSPWITFALVAFARPVSSEAGARRPRPAVRSSAIFGRTNWTGCGSEPDPRWPGRTSGPGSISWNAPSPARRGTASSGPAGGGSGGFRSRST